MTQGKAVSRGQVEHGPLSARGRVSFSLLYEGDTAQATRSVARLKKYFKKSKGALKRAPFNNSTSER